MSEAGYKMTDIFDATSYYASELGSDTRSRAAEMVGRGEEWYMRPENDRSTFELKGLGATRHKGASSSEKVKLGYQFVAKCREIKD